MNGSFSACPSQATVSPSHSISQRKEAQKAGAQGAGTSRRESSALASLFGYVHISSSHREEDPWQKAVRDSQPESQLEDQGNSRPPPSKG